ncbi:hypothetical protein RDABS01_039414, partial [Bienertia sinuspersici]
MEQQQQNVEASTEHESTSPRLTYRQKRRLEQAELRLKIPDRKRRGPNRSKKYEPRMWNSNFEEKIKINFMDELRHVVSKKADEFICDCSNWVKEYCPLDSWLYDKIRGKYDLPEKVAGADVTEALSFQCSMLYKDKSVANAINSRPNNIDVGPWTWLVCDYWNREKQSKVNTENKLKQTKTPANGVRSTARIFHELMRHQLNQLKNLMDRLCLMKLNKMLCTSPYLRKQKRSGWEPNVEKDYEALKRLHEKEVKKHREDTLSVKDVYMEVFKQKSRHVKGFGLGAHPPKKCRADGESNEARTEIETLKASNDELKISNEELIASNDEFKATFSRNNIEATKREKKLRDDIMKMFEQM